MEIQFGGPVKIDSTDYHLNLKLASMADETSVSHMLRKPSELMNGRTYGEAIVDSLIERGVSAAGTPMSVVEVGGGLGDFAYSAIPRFTSYSGGLDYTMLDICPTLREAQQNKTKEFGDVVHHIEGSALDLRNHISGEVDLVIAVECVGDFEAIRGVPFNRGGNPTGTMDDESFDSFRDADCELWNKAWNLIERYQLSVPVEEDFIFDFIIPTGQIAYLEQLDQVIRPGGMAVIIEHCSPYSRRVDLPSHMEVSMSRKHLLHVADSLGFEAEFICLRELLGISDPKIPIVKNHIVNYTLYFGMSPEQHLVDLKEKYERARSQIDLGEVPDCYPPFEDLSDNGREYYAERLSEGEPIELSLPFETQQSLWRQCELDPNNKILDRHLTLNEFQEERKRCGWDNPAFDNPEIEYISSEIANFGAILLRKPF